MSGFAVTEYEIACDYESSLHELVSNQKPHINMLTMLADDNQRYAAKIVGLIENRIRKVPVSTKMPLMHLIDSILKKCESYRHHFANNFEETFRHVFFSIDKKERQDLIDMRESWQTLLPNDVINKIDQIIEDSVAISHETSSSFCSTSFPSPCKNVVIKTELPDEIEPDDIDYQSIIGSRLDVSAYIDDVKPDIKPQLPFINEQHNNSTLSTTTPPPVVQAKLTENQFAQALTPEMTQMLRNILANTKNITNSSNNAAPPFRAPILLNGNSTSVTSPTKSIPKINSPTKSANERFPLMTAVVKSEPLDRAGSVRPAEEVETCNNNRIFVDGRSYEVRFVQDTAIIQRNGLPHIVTFVGKAKEVVVDGKPYKLAFDGKSVDVLINNRPVQMRFGAPSRELYVNGVALRGAFGGPPILMSINGAKHRIQLCGPPPEVHIEAEPSYELVWFLRQSSATTPAAAATTPPLAPHNALGRHQRHPLANNILSRRSMTNSVSVCSSTSSDDAGRRLSMNATGFEIPEQSFVLESRPCPLTTLIDFNMNMLRIRYKSIVEDLYSNRKLQCSSCGLRFRDADRRQYSAHLNWHFAKKAKIELAAQDSPPSDATGFWNWFPPAEVWLSDAEFSDNDRKAFVQKNHRNLPSCSTTRPLNVSAERCRICGEKFEQLWDEEDELWKLSNVKFIGNEVFHSTCCDVSARNGEGIGSEPEESMEPVLAQSSGINAPGTVPVDLATLSQNLRRLIGPDGLQFAPQTSTLIPSTSEAAIMIPGLELNTLQQLLINKTVKREQMDTEDGFSRPVKNEPN